MKTMTKLLTNKLKALSSSEKIKKQMRRSLKTYVVVNDENPHDLFEVEATDPNTAAHAALTHLGWWLAEDQYIR
jgi:hypothetical protein